MKKIISVCVLGVMLTNSYAVDLAQFINPQNCDEIVTNSVYTACYNYKLKGSTYVAYTVDGTKLLDADIHIKKRPTFYPENSIPVKYRSFPEDYTNSGYDRGHMANHADFDYSANLVYATYSMVNIVPQNPELNRKTWVKAERYERMVAKRLGQVNVLNIINYSNNPKRIGKHQIAVPSGFVKVVYNDSNGIKKCFGYQNNAPTVKDNLREHEIDCKGLGI